MHTHTGVSGRSLALRMLNHDGKALAMQLVRHSLRSPFSTGSWWTKGRNEYNSFKVLQEKKMTEGTTTLDCESTHLRLSFILCMSPGLLTLKRLRCLLNRSSMLPANSLRSENN